jgi:hypothetical protein
LVESLERGIEQGRAEERRELPRRAVSRRVGAIPPNLEMRIAGADSEALTALFDQVVVAAPLEEI